LFENSGWVCPNLNLPHCDFPYADHPCGFRASERMSDQPIGFLPHPIASAIGFHIAITTGDSISVSVGPNRSLPVLALDCALPSLIKAADAGLGRWACRVPERSSSIASPEPIGIAFTNIALPLAALCSPRLNWSVTSLIQASFSELYVKTNSIEFGLGVGAVESLF